jgi:uncharacterized protein YhfF
MTDDRAPAVDAYWRAYCDHAAIDPDERVDVYAFGDSPEMADRLLAIVLDGPKRATAGLYEDYEEGGEPLPVVGQHSVILDGAGFPAAVVRTTDVRIRPMQDVDEAFAWDEGEGDRSLAYWIDAHRDFFTRHLEQQGRTFDDSMLVVLERFELVWPTADQPVS